MAAMCSMVLQRWNMDPVHSVLQQRRHMGASIMEGRDAFELGDDRGDSTEILGSAGMCAGGWYHYIVVQAAEEEAEGQCL